MSDIFKINTNNPIPYSEITIKISESGAKVYHPVPVTSIDIGNIQNKYSNKFLNQPPLTGAIV